jgi:nitrite reductase/ring-hydroxylating ferredoxin subunit
MEFIFVCKEDELQSKGKVLGHVNGRDIAVFLSGDQIYAIANRCPHHGAPLFFGKVCGTVTSDAPGDFQYIRENGLIVCPWHRREVDLQTGEFIAEPKRKVLTFAVKVENGEVFVGPKKANSSALAK